MGGVVLVEPDPVGQGDLEGTSISEKASTTSTTQVADRQPSTIILTFEILQELLVHDNEC